MTPRPDNTFAPQNLDAVRDAMHAHGVERIFIKCLAKNDNRKQQIYVGPDLSTLTMLPARPIESHPGTSQKHGKAVSAIFHMPLDWHWLDRHGAACPAPNTKLIYYPQFPEVRLSGFLKNAVVAPRSLMIETNRIAGRYLLFGVGNAKRVFGVVLPPASPAARELESLNLPRFNDLFSEMSAKRQLVGDSRELLITRLREIHEKGWIPAQRLRPDGTLLRPYENRNSGGYTLEAELGITPNGDSKPDFLGWEIKQFSLPKCSSQRSAPVTLMTPEPDGGYYVDEGKEAFLIRYGYANPRIPQRRDFTGRHIVGTKSTKTGTTLRLEGVDSTTGEMISSEGGVILERDGDSQPAARWSFAKLLEHWIRKHQKAAYIPALTRNSPKEHFYCPIVRLAEETEFPKLLKVLAAGIAYYDPGIKIEQTAESSETKPRSQFRIGTSNLESLYARWNLVDVTE